MMLLRETCAPDLTDTEDVAFSIQRKLSMLRLGDVLCILTFHP